MKQVPCASCGKLFHQTKGLLLCSFCHEFSTRKSKRLVLEAWHTQGCQICGEKRRPALEAAHRIPVGGRDKVRVTQIINGSYSVKKLEEELAKCVCLCATCHRLVDAGWLQMPPEVPLPGS